jgi:hypothetical protein
VVPHLFRDGLTKTRCESVQYSENLLEPQPRADTSCRFGSSSYRSQLFGIRSNSLYRRNFLRQSAAPFLAITAEGQDDLFKVAELFPAQVTLFPTTARAELV